MHSDKPRKFRIIQPLRRLEKYPSIISWDTEAYRYETDEGERQEFAIGYCFDGQTAFKFSSLNEFIDYAFALKGKHMFVAHNAMYDMQLTGLKYWILTHPEYQHMKRTDDLILDGKVWVRYVRKGKNYAELIFADSFQYLPASLDDLIKKYLESKKYASKDEYKLSPDEWNAYIQENGDELCRNDTIQLWKIFMKFLSFLSANQFPLGMTIASTAMKTFRLRFQEGSDLFYPNTDDYNTDIIEAYRGGYTNVLQLGQVENVVVYDVNSLYPYSMKNKMPVRYVSKVKIRNYEHYQKLKERFYIIARCDFVAGENISFITKRINSKLYPLKSGQCVLHEPEIDYILGTGGTILFDYAYLYNFRTDLFDSYVDFFYKLKSDARDDVTREIAKLFLNAMYGKFGQHGRYSKIITKDEPEEYDEPIRYDDGQGHIISDYGYFKIVRQDGHPRYSPEIAGAITAYARIYLWKLVQIVGVQDWLYSDTDSVHTTNHKLDTMVSDKLGDMKIEKTGTAIYVAPKVYYFNGKLKHKGINGRDVKIEENKYIHNQFSRLRTTAKNGVVIQKVIKQFAYDNDKLEFEGDRAIRSFTEQEIMAPQIEHDYTKYLKAYEKLVRKQHKEAEEHIDGFEDYLDPLMSKSEARRAFWHNMRHDNM